MLPYLAQGANSSLEDGAVLGHLLGFMKHKTQLPRILRLYESLRKSRGESIVRETFKQVCIVYHQLSFVIKGLIRMSSDMTSTCPMVRSNGNEMRFSSRS